MTVRSRCSGLLASALVVSGLVVASVAAQIAAPELAAATSYDSAVLADSPTAYWRLGDASGSSTAADASGGGHSLSVSSFTFGAPGAIATSTNTAATLAGASTGTAAMSSFSPTTLSAEAWVRTKYQAGTGADHDVVSAMDTPSGTYQYLLGVNAAGKAFAKVWAGGTSYQQVGNNLISDGAWHQLAASYDGSHLNLYVDGNLDGAVAASGSISWPSTVTWTVGTPSNCSSCSVVGDVDEVAVFNHTVSSTDISGHFSDAGTPTIGCTSSDGYSALVCATSPVGYWRLGESSLTAAAADQSSLTNAGAYTPTGGTGPTLGVSGVAHEANTAMATSSTDSSDVMTVPYQPYGHYATPQGSLVGWVNLASPIPGTPSDRTLLQVGGGGGSGLRLALQVDSSTADAKAEINIGGTYYTLTSAQTLNGWHLMALTYDGSTAKLSVDGTVVSTLSQPEVSWRPPSSTRCS